MNGIFSLNRLLKISLGCESQPSVYTVKRRGWIGLQNLDNILQVKPVQKMLLAKWNHQTVFTKAYFAKVHLMVQMSVALIMYSMFYSNFKHLIFPSWIVAKVCNEFFPLL